MILGDSRLLGEAHGEAEGSEAHAPHAMPHAPRACFLEIRCSQAGIPGQGQPPHQAISVRRLLASAQLAASAPADFSFFVLAFTVPCIIYRVKPYGSRVGTHI